MATKKRRRKHGALAKVTAERLEELRRERGLTVEAFARSFGATVHTTYAAWRNGQSVPGGYYLRKIAEEYGVTADWLLGMKGAARYAEAPRSAERLFDEVEVHIRTELRKREAAGKLGVGTSIQWEGENRWPISGAKALAAA